LPVTAQAPFIASNGLGYVASALILVTLVEWQQKKTRGMDAFLQHFYSWSLFLFASSRTSLAIIIIGIGVIFMRKSALGALLYIGLTVFLIATFRIFFTEKLLQGNNLDVFWQLSGRVPLWEASVDLWKSAPLLGIGGGSAGKIIVPELLGPDRIPTALHNGFLETITGLGLIGFIIGTGTLIAITKSTFKMWKKNSSIIPICALITHMWIVTIMSSGVLGWLGYEIILYYILAGYVDLNKKTELIHES
jgi:O-antigen ligase